MKNVYIYCEGPTEESFINEILYPYFFNTGIVVYPVICTTKRTVNKKPWGDQCEQSAAEARESINKALYGCTR